MESEGIITTKRLIHNHLSATNSEWREVGVAGGNQSFLRGRSRPVFTGVFWMTAKYSKQMQLKAELSEQAGHEKHNNRRSDCWLIDWTFILTAVRKFSLLNTVKFQHLFLKNRWCCFGDWRFFWRSLKWLLFSKSTELVLCCYFECQQSIRNRCSSKQSWASKQGMKSTIIVEATVDRLIERLFWRECVSFLCRKS